MTKKPKLISSIRAKLVSAVAMLLVAMIMVVSSTYAWFTRSTAPEVTGISTSIGANGALEMAMMNKDGLIDQITAGVGDSISAGKTIDEVNRTWGNLVDVKDNTVYGLNQIVLMPSQLNAEGNILQKSMLKTPVYGADGRVSDLLANTMFGNYSNGSFMPGDEFGLRGVGVTSGMSDRQLAYRNALSQASTAAGTAKNLAAVSLETQGSTLANVAIKKATATDASPATFTEAEIESLLAITNDLLGTEDTVGALEHIENAYKQYLLAYAASSDMQSDASTWMLLKGAIDGGSLTFVVDNGTASAQVPGTEGSTQTVALPSELNTVIVKLDTTKKAVQSAQNTLRALGADSTDDTVKTYTWDQITSALNQLANPSAMKVNGITTDQIKEKMNELIGSVTSQGGLTVSMSAGAGVYADIADHCGNYNASITIAEVTYGGLTLNNMAARMKTDSNQNPTFLTGVGNFVSNKAPAATGEVQPLSEFYGYILDLAFRTNAPESHLLLQTAATDRIYEDNTNDATMGGGSSMTFASTSPNFSTQNVKDLMENIRIVFFTPDLTKQIGGTILAEARLDVANATVGADGVTANMYLLDADKNMIKTQADAKIQALTQNAPTAVSVLVYLDGTTMTNADVGFDKAASVTGTANFQFSSSANLVPMEYANLHTPGAAGSETTAAPTNP